MAGRARDNNTITLVSHHRFCVDRTQVEMDWKTDQSAIPKDNLIKVPVENSLKSMLGTSLSRKLMFSRNQPLRMLWDYFVMMIATYNVLVLPLEIAFKHEIFESLWYTRLNTVCDIIFGIDILVVFRTSILY